MKALNYDKILGCLKTQWGIPFNATEGITALAKAFAQESDAACVHLKILRRTGTTLPVEPEWNSLFGVYQKLPEADLAKALAGLVNKILRSKAAEGRVFRQWYGPADAEGVGLAADEALLICSFPFLDWIGGIAVICKKVDAEGEHLAQWGSDLVLIAASLVDRVTLFLASDLGMKQRREFYEKLSEVATSRPSSDLPRLCKIWKEASGADWVWLWMHNETAQQWELVGCAPNDNPDFMPESFTTPERNCVAEFCNRVQKPKFIDNPNTWSDKERGEDFKVTLGGLFKKLNCIALDCIPLLPPPRNSGAPEGVTYAPLRIRGAVCLHYRDIKRRREQPEDVYLLMGRLSAWAIRNSYEAEQRHVLFSLNHLTEKHWTESNTRPGERREGYLRDLRELVSAHLNVKYVTIFWKDTFQNKLVCLESTGLWNAEGKPVPRPLFSDVRYGPNQGITGTVFASGEPYLSQIGATANHKPLFTEIPPALKEADMAWIVCPIPFIPGEKRGQGLSPVSGVIRCGENKTVLGTGKPRDFDSIQLEELSFITRQIAPVLEAMAANIAREMIISVVKHDLFAPIRMIADSAEEIALDIKNQRHPRDYALENLTTSGFLAGQLVKQLDPDPTTVGQLNLQPTLIEGDILGRIKAMLRHYAKHESSMEISFGDFRGFPAVKVDRVLIERVLHNLIMNAIKYGKEGTEIKVMPLARRDGLIIAVSNYGLGIEPDEAPYLFSQNYRSPRAQQRTHGLGLGLKIALSAMKAHDGNLVLSQPKDPTIFSMIFPRSVISSQ